MEENNKILKDCSQADTLTTRIGLHCGSNLNSWTGLFAKVLVTSGWDSALETWSLSPARLAKYFAVHGTLSDSD